VSDGDGGMSFFYPLFMDVHVMIFVGFGFLMTFLHRYQFSALGFTFFLGALVLQAALLTNGFWHMVHSNHWEKIHLDVTSLIRADFVAGSVLITFGALLGKATPLQLLVVGLVECVVQGASEVVGAAELGAVDMGGSIFVHAFGAYFGLACSWAMARASNGYTYSRGGAGEKDAQQQEQLATSLSAHPKCRSDKQSDTLAMVGTLFLWLFWPSFNGALASGSQQHRVVVNTVLSLAACCLAAFAASALLRKHKKFDMVDIQNATLAGGVAVGSSSDLVIQPWGALVIGICAGWLSVYGYVYVTPWLERKYGLHDTCGVHNLHGLPGILGAVGGAVSAALAGDSHVIGDNVNDVFPRRAPATPAEARAQGWVDPATNATLPLGDGRSAGEQGLYQLAALLAALALATVGGLIAGRLACAPCFGPFPSSSSSKRGGKGQKKGGNTDKAGARSSRLFEDEVYWECPEEEEEEEEEEWKDDAEEGRASGGGREMDQLRLGELKAQLVRLTAAVAEYERGGGATGMAV